MDGVRTRLSGPVIGCGDAWELADFYASLLGWKLVDRSEKDPGGWALVKSPDGNHKLEFQREAPFVPRVWPTVAGQQQMGMHLDIAVDGLAPIGEMEQRREQFLAEVEPAKSLGARVAEHQPQPARVLVMLDPAGHPFCLFPGDRTATVDTLERTAPRTARWKASAWQVRRRPKERSGERAVARPVAVSPVTLGSRPAMTPVTPRV